MHNTSDKHITLNFTNGMLYFLVTYEDQRSICPKIDPVVFLGKDVFPDSSSNETESKWYFQDAESFAYDQKLSGSIQALPLGALNAIFDAETITAGLGECVRRWIRANGDGRHHSA